MEKRKRLWLIDAGIILLMIAAVFLFCQPIGRDWDEAEIEQYIGTEGPLSPDADSYYYLRKAKEFTEKGISSIRPSISRTEDELITQVQSGTKDSMPQLLSVLAALLWYLLRFLGIRVGIYTLSIRLCSVLLAGIFVS